MPAQWGSGTSIPPPVISAKELAEVARVAPRGKTELKPCAAPNSPSAKSDGRGLLTAGRICQVKRGPATIVTTSSDEPAPPVFPLCPKVRLAASDRIGRAHV